jgi:hypothetical protein
MAPMGQYQKKMTAVLAPARHLAGIAAKHIGRLVWLARARSSCAAEGCGCPDRVDICRGPGGRSAVEVSAYYLVLLPALALLSDAALFAIVGRAVLPPLRPETIRALAGLSALIPFAARFGYPLAGADRAEHTVASHLGNPWRIGRECLGGQLRADHLRNPRTNMLFPPVSPRRPPVGADRHRPGRRGRARAGGASSVPGGGRSQLELGDAADGSAGAHGPRARLREVASFSDVDVFHLSSTALLPR